MPAAPQVSIIIINYKTFGITTQCIDSVIRHTQRTSYEIILVENGTGEFTSEHTARWGSAVKLVVSEQNLGFAGGNNLGLAAATGKYILLLNSDTYLTDDAISATVDFLQEHPDAGAVSPRLVYPDGRTQSIAQRFPSAWYGLIELLRLQKLLGKQTAGKLLLGPFFDHNSTVRADWVWGAALMIPRAVLDQLPGKQLDEQYFMYWEDVQWCKDIRSLGYEIYFFAGATIVHIQEGSKGKTNDMMRRSEALFFRRNYSAAHYKLIKLINKCLGI